MLVGDVRDASGAAIVNAALTVSSAALIGGTRETTSDRTGVYHVLALPPGDYELTAGAPGFRSQRRSPRRARRSDRLVVHHVPQAFPARGVPAGPVAWRHESR